MADEEVKPAESPKKGKSAKGGAKKSPAKKAKPTVNHPVVSVMVNTAIAKLKERNGSSLQAIKKYVASNYKVDADRLAPFIRKYIKKAVAEGKLVQTKGTGASGSFKMSSAADKSTQKPKAAAKKPVAAKKPKAAKPKKTPTKKPKAAKPKKSPAAKKAKASKPKPKKSPAKKTKTVKKTPKKGKK